MTASTRTNLQARGDRRSLLAWGGVLIVAMTLLYAFTLQPVINGSSDAYAEDVGEFQNVLTQWGTAHPTGYPLYASGGALVASLLRIFGVAPAAAASTFSAIVMVLALIGVYLLLVRVSVRPPLAAGTAALLGLLFPFWYHASVAEVYALLIALVVLALLIAVQWRIDRRPIHLYQLAFVCGLAVGHHRLAVLMGPALLILIGPVLLAALRERPIRLIGGFLSLAAAFLIYLYLPLRAWQGGNWIYGQPDTWNGFWAIALAREYGALVKSAANPNQAEAGITQVLNVLADNLTWPLFTAGVLGLIVAFKSGARRWLALALATLLLANLVFAGLYSHAVFLPAALMPAMLCVVLGVGMLAESFAERLRVGTGAAAIALSLVAILLVYTNGPQIYTMTHDATGQQIIEAVQAAEVNRMSGDPVVMALWGRDYFALAYAQGVTGDLAGIGVVDHRANVKNIVTSGQTLFVLNPTFYLLPLEWWNARLGRTYLSSYAGDLVRVSNQPILAETDVPAQAATVPMGPSIVLRNWQVKPLADGRSWQITLFWQALDKPDRNYSVFVHASDQASVDAPNAIVAQADSSAPVYGWYPTSRWSPGEIVRDDHVITFPPGQPGRIAAVGLYTQDASGSFRNFGQQIIPLR